MESAEDCPTGLLIDFNESRKEPSSASGGVGHDDNNHLLNMAEFDDTFGIFSSQEEMKDGQGERKQSTMIMNLPTGRLIPTSANHSLNSTASPFGLGLGNCKSNRANRILQSVLISNSNLSVTEDQQQRLPSSDPFSPAFLLKNGHKGEDEKGQDASEDLQSDNKDMIRNTADSNADDSPRQENGNADPTDSPSCVKSEANFSAGSDDSFLDIANLSSFDADTDGIDELLNEMKEKNDLSELGNDIENQAEDEKDVVAKKQLEVLKNNPEVAERRRRDSINSNLQRLSMLISSPIASPGTCGVTNYIPTPSAATPACGRRSLAFAYSSCTPISHIGTMTSPYKSENNLASAEKTYTKPIVESKGLLSPSSVCSRYLTTPSRSSTKIPPQTDTSYSEPGISGKRLSFTSTSSDANSSPSKSVTKCLPKVMGVKFNPSFRGSLQRVAPKEPSSSQPLKAIAKVDTGFKRNSNANTSKVEKERTTPNAIKPNGKYIPPVAQSSPLRMSITGSSKDRTTPTVTRTSSMRSGTTPVRRSTVTPGRNNSFTTANPTHNSPKFNKPLYQTYQPLPSNRTALGLSNNLARPDTIGKYQPRNSNTAITNLTKPHTIAIAADSIKKDNTGIPQTVSNLPTFKENRPKIMKSALPRPGGWKKP